VTACGIWTAASLLSAALVGWVAPFWAMKRLVPVLERTRLTANYRGRRVFTGLGLVWLVWAAAYALVGGVWSATLGAATAFRPAEAGLMPAHVFYEYYWSAAAIALVIGAMALGLVDDLFGDASSRGFRGHLVALRAGRLTTGALKMFGIGALAVGAALPATSSMAWAASSGLRPSAVTFAAAWVLAALAIALCANLVNLTDLRPGRALKSFSALAALAVLAAMWRVSALDPRQGDSQAVSLWLPLVAGVVLAVLVLGPVAAVWRYDLGERGMLGDAGSNAMGALAGYLLASSLPLWLLAIVAAALLALNLASERVSFSRVIEERPLLRWIDGLGRLEADGPDGRPVDGDAGNLVEKGEGPMGTDADATDAEQGRDGGS
jgi:hypothetical protein